MKIDLETPVAWKRHKAFSLGRRALVVVAFAPSIFTVGAEVVYRNAYGIGFYFGPLLFVFAVAKEEEGE